METTALERTPSADDKPFESNGVTHPAPEGTPFNPDPNKWYYLKARYLRDDKETEGYFHPVGQNAARAFWDYIRMDGGTTGACQLKFKKMEGQAWYTAEVRADGYHLCIKATGWMYRASHYTAGFMIIDDKLYVDSWSGPLGCANSYKLDAETYYVGADLANQLAHCELVEA